MIFSHKMGMGNGLKRTVAEKLRVITDMCLSIRTRLLKLGTSNNVQREKGFFFW